MPISLVSYAATPDKCFVRVPNERGRWVLTDRCVIEVECPQCKAIKGEPCFRHFGVEPKTQHYWTDTHFARRSAWQKLRREQPELADPARSKPRLSYQDFLTNEPTTGETT